MKKLLLLLSLTGLTAQAEELHLYCILKITKTTDTEVTQSENFPVTIKSRDYNFAASAITPLFNIDVNSLAAVTEETHQNLTDQHKWYLTYEGKGTKVAFSLDRVNGNLSYSKKSKAESETAEGKCVKAVPKTNKF